jgi:mannose-6-phosphate isomerase-like protein (cupin superfamily)
VACCDPAGRPKRPARARPRVQRDWRLADLVPAGPLRERRYVELHRSADLSVGLYLLPRGADDPQQPHGEDEVYHVVRGRARFERAGRVMDVEPGSVLVVPAREPHRFRDVAEDLVVLVAFGPAEGSRPR